MIPIPLGFGPRWLRRRQWRRWLDATGRRTAEGLVAVQQGAADEPEPATSPPTDATPEPDVVERQIQRMVEAIVGSHATQQRQRNWGPDIPRCGCDLVVYSRCYRTHHQRSAA